jgi:hypothetical protein
MKLPKYVVVHKGHYVWRPYLGRVNGKTTFGKRVKLCPVGEDVWSAYEKATLITEKATPMQSRQFPDLPATHRFNTAFFQARKNAALRGIEFKFTKAEWYEWWGDDLSKRGQSPDSLCMGRYGDAGAYEPSNVYKCSLKENGAGPRCYP